jgi:peroxiredoxin
MLGYWIEVIKRVCTFILIVAGIYFVISGAVKLAYAQDTEILRAELDFSLNDLSGNSITLSEFRDKKPVILFFWTTWCPRCIRRLNKLNQIYSSLASDNIEVLAINVGQGESKVRGFLKDNPVPFKVLLDEDHSIARSYGLIGTPTFVLITKAGDVVFKDCDFPKDTYKKLLF